MKGTRALVLAVVLSQLGEACDGAVTVSAVSRGAKIFRDGEEWPTALINNATSGSYSPVPLFTVFTPGISGVELEAVIMHSSDISSAAFHGFGRASAEAKPGVSGVFAIDAYAFFDVDFSVSAPQAFRLSGVLDKATFSPEDFEHASFTLTGPASFSYFNETFERSGVLNPGDYHLVVDALASAIAPNTSRGVTFDFELSFVPEPSATLLVAWAAMGLSAMSGRAKLK